MSSLQYIYTYSLWHTRSTIKYVDCLTTSVCGRIRVVPLSYFTFYTHFTSFQTYLIKVIHKIANKLFPLRIRHAVASSATPHRRYEERAAHLPARRQITFPQWFWQYYLIYKLVKEYLNNNKKKIPRCCWIGVQRKLLPQYTMMCSRLVSVVRMCACMRTNIIDVWYIPI